MRALRNGILLLMIIATPASAQMDANSALLNGLKERRLGEKAATVSCSLGESLKAALSSNSRDFAKSITELRANVDLLKASVSESLKGASDRSEIKYSPEEEKRLDLRFDSRQFYRTLPGILTELEGALTRTRRHIDELIDGNGNLKQSISDDDARSAFLQMSAELNEALELIGIIAAKQLRLA